MSNRYAKDPKGLSSEPHPKFATHYYYRIDVVDQITGERWPIEGCSSEDSKQAAEDAHRQANAKMRELESRGPSTEEA